MLEINTATKDNDLKIIRSEIMSNASSGYDILMYSNPETGEEIVLSQGILVGTLNGKYFGCSCYRPGSKLFFKESRDLKDNNPKNYQAMSFTRVHEFLDEIDARLESVGNSYYMRLQMHSVREQYNLECQTKTNKREYNIQKKLDEAAAAAERRRQNEERTRQRKAQREAERLKRKKIAETTKRIHADAAKAVAERKAEEARKKQAKKEALLRTAEEEKRLENERMEQSMMNSFNQHADLPPVFEYDKNGYECFYLKIKGKVIHIIMHPEKPKCQILTPTSSEFLGVYTFMDVRDNIEENLNSQEQIEPILEKLPYFYKKCMDIQSVKTNEEKRRQKGLTNPQSVTCAEKDAPALYKKICTRLMTPYANPNNANEHNR